MFEVILDTETTGLSTAQNHKIVEIGCVELSNQIPTGKVFHKRFKPKIHNLNYSVFSFLISLNEIDELDQNLKLRELLLRA